MSGKRTDLNHAEIRDGLRELPGVSVKDMSQHPKCLDLLVGFRGSTYWFEVKQPGKRGDLTRDESEIMNSWWGHVSVVATLEEAKEEIGWEEIGWEEIR